MILPALKEQGYSMTLVHGATKSKYPVSTVALTFKNNTGEDIDVAATTERSEPHVMYTVTQFKSTYVMPVKVNIERTIEGNDRLSEFSGCRFLCFGAISRFGGAPWWMFFSGIAGIEAILIEKG